MLVTRQKEAVFGKNNFIGTFCLAFQKSQVRFKVWNQFPPAIVSNLLGKRPVKMVACLSTNMFWITKPRRVTLMVIRQHTRLETWNGTLVTVSKWGLPTRQNGETWVSWKQRLPSSVSKIQSLLPLQTYNLQNFAASGQSFTPQHQYACSPKRFCRHLVTLTVKNWN